MSKPLNTIYTIYMYFCMKTMKTNRVFQTTTKNYSLFLILPIFRSGGPQSSQELTKSLLSWSKIDHKILLL